jgi:hypothetical protein
MGFSVVRNASDGGVLDWRGPVSARTLNDMNNLWRDSQRRISAVHRGGAVAMALGLGAFGVLGVLNRLDPFSTSGQPVLGLSSNGLLSAISLVVAGVLLVAAVRGGRTASTTLVVVGALFVLSGLLNTLVLGTALNLLAFRIPNVVFSLVAGAVLLTVGAYGRFTGRLPEDNPYHRDRPSPWDAERPEPDPPRLREPADARAAAELAAAERAAAQHRATPEQRARLAAVGALRRVEDRVRAWRQHGAERRPRGAAQA